MAIRILSSENITGNITLHHPSNAPYIDFVENADTGDSKARITMDQIDTNNGKLIFSTENSGTLTNALVIDNSGVVTVGTSKRYVDSGNTQFDLEVTEGMAFGGAAFTYATIQGDSAGLGNIEICANAYPANTGAESKITFKTSTTSGGQYDDVLVIKGSKVGIGTDSPAQNFVVATTTNGIGIELVPGTLSYIQAYNRGTSDYSDLKIDAETIAFGTDNGAQRMLIRSSGTVGIGSDGFDSQMLTIAAGTLDGAIYATSTDANCFASFRDNSSTANIEYGAIGNNHVFRKDATEQMRIASDGSVTIGSSTLTGPRSLTLLSATNATNYDINFQQAGTTNYGRIRFTEGASDFQFIPQVGQGPNLTLQYGGNSFFSRGNVGIGTTSPTLGKLQVEGSGYFGPVGTGNATTKAEMQSNAVLRLKPHDNNSTNINFAQVNNGGGIGIQTTNGPGTANWDIALSPFGGNVGIGTANPAYALDVDGMVAIRNSTGPQLLFFETGSAYTDGMRLLRYQDKLSLTYGWNANEEALTVVGGTGSDVGNVGIGTTSPGSKLEVNVSDDTFNDIDVLKLRRTWSTASGSDRAHGISFNDPNAVNAAIYADRTNSGSNYKSDLVFITNTGASGTNTSEKLRITSDGRVEVTGNVLSIDTVDEYRQDFSTTGASTPSFDIDLKSIGASGQPFEVFVAWTHYATTYGAGLHQAYYQRSTVQSNISLIHTYFNQTSSNGGAWSVVWLTGTEIRVQKSAGTHAGQGYGYIRVTRLKP